MHFSRQEQHQFLQRNEGKQLIITGYKYLYYQQAGKLFWRSGNSSVPSEQDSSCRQNLLEAIPFCPLLHRPGGRQLKDSGCSELMGKPSHFQERSSVSHCCSRVRIFVNNLSQVICKFSSLDRLVFCSTQSLCSNPTQAQTSASVTPTANHLQPHPPHLHKDSSLTV